MTATTSPHSRSHDRNPRRRPFSAWMKRLTNLKSSSSETDPSTSNQTKGNSSSKGKKAAHKNNPYPESAYPQLGGRYDGNRQSTGESQDTSSLSLTENGISSTRSSKDGRAHPTTSNKSAAPTISTNPGTVHSDAHAASSVGATNGTIGGNLSARENGSTFSSPAPSVRSLATTLTTIQSTGPSNLLGSSTAAQPSSFAPNQQTSSNPHGVQFSHQFPSSPPASAVPPHLQPPPAGSSGGNITTYSTATANNLLTDNASILTLASSSKRRRRHSLDTNASVRALAPSSIFGGSRESLPLSVLSSNVDTNPIPTQGGAHQGRPSASGIPGGERASVYSASGVAPTLTSERSSYYAGKAPAGGDGASIHSGFLGHSRNDSITGSLGATATSSPLVSTREGVSTSHSTALQSSAVLGATAAGGASASSHQGPGKISRRGSGWGDVGEDVDDEEKSGSSSKK